MTPEQAAQAQLDAYNAHDVDAFVACYAEDVEAHDLLSGKVIVSGREAMRTLYAPLFKNEALKAEVIERMVFKSVVVDKERVRTGTGEDMQALAIYDVADGLIQRAWFVQ